VTRFATGTRRPLDNGPRGVASEHPAPFRKGCPQDARVSVHTEVHPKLSRKEVVPVRRLVIDEVGQPHRRE
jgi:hypothetical protein